MFRQQRSISSCRSLVVLASLLLSCVLVLWSCAGGGGSSSGFSGGSGGSGGGGEVLGLEVRGAVVHGPESVTLCIGEV